MNEFVRSFAASLLALIVLIGAIVGVVNMKMNEKSKIEKHSYLIIDIYGPIAEYDDPGGVMGELMGEDGETLQRILSNLEKVEVDDRIDGVVFKLSSTNSLGMASSEEIRGAIRRVQAVGKPVIGFADTMDRSTYYLASACDEIYAVPTAYISYHGVAGVRRYLAGTLEKLGIEADLHKIKDYKAAAEMMQRTDMSEFARENAQWILDDLWEQGMLAITEDRGLSEAEVLAIMEYAVLTASEALERGLFDGLLYWDELANRLRGEDEDELRMVSQARYAQEKASDLGLKGKETIAVIHAHGLIGGRHSSVHPLLGTMIGHETVVAELERARKDEDVAAIVFRVDSGGGDALTSDIIGHAVERAAQDKPVIVSMVNVAASGGYHISYRGTKILADATTITGSIGSISGKFNMSGLYEKLGFDHDYITKGPMALYDVDFRAYTPEEKARHEADHWLGFNHWLRDVSEHRGMSFEEVESLAHGRVWTGTQGAANGLVDEVGGYHRAIEVAKELAEIKADDSVTVMHYPEKGDLLEMVMSGVGEASLAVRYALYKQLRSEWSTTTSLLQSGHFDLAPQLELR